MIHRLQQPAHLKLNVVHSLDSFHAAGARGRARWCKGNMFTFVLCGCHISVLYYACGEMYAESLEAVGMIRTLWFGAFVCFGF